MQLLHWRGWVQKHTPIGARVAVIALGDGDWLRLHERESWHFPCDERGRHAAPGPAGDDEALAMLAAARSAGVQFLAVPEHCSSWLDGYPEFRRSLERQFTSVAALAHTGVLYDLQSQKAG